tara:strand:- start:927 stop:1127 length:201 start_codon:yes stop_codon:yes gene_type:complete
MEILLKSNDIIFVSWVKHQLTEEQIDFNVFDENMSLMDGNICAIPIRIMVNTEDLEKAKKIIALIK